MRNNYQNQAQNDREGYQIGANKRQRFDEPRKEFMLFTHSSEHLGAEELIREVKDISNQKSNEKRGKNIENSCYDAPNDIKVILDKQQKHRKGYRYQDIPHR